MKRAFAMIVALVVATPRIAGAGEPGPADAPPLEQVEQDLERRNADLDARLGEEATRTRERLDLDVQRSLVDQKTREEADRRVPGELRVEQARATKRQHFIRFSISMALSLVFLGAGGYELRAAKNEHDAIAAGSFATGADIDASNDRFEKDNKYGVVLVGAGALLGVVSILGLTGTLFDDPESASNRCCAVNAAQKVLGCIPDVNVKEDTAFTEVGARCLVPPVRPTFATQRPTQARTRSPMRADAAVPAERAGAVEPAAWEDAVEAVAPAGALARAERAGSQDGARATRRERRTRHALPAGACCDFNYPRKCKSGVCAPKKDCNHIDCPLSCG